MRRAVLWTTLGASLLLLLWWTMESYQYVAHLPSPARDRAASALLLERHDVASRRLNSQAQLFPLPDTRSVLIFREPRGRMETEQLSQLKHWIADGGTIILDVALNSYAPEEPEEGATETGAKTDTGPGPDGNGLDAGTLNDKDPLAYAFGVTGWHWLDDENLIRGPVTPPANHLDTDWAESFFQQYCLEATDDDQDQCNSIMCGDTDNYVAYTHGQLDQRQYLLDLDPHGHLLHRGLFDLPVDAAAEEDHELAPAAPQAGTGLVSAMGNEQALQLLELSLGQGRIIALTDTGIWSNQRLHHLDHAALLVDLTRHSDTVVWIEHVDMPPLLDWLWPRAWPLMIVAILLIAFLVWRALPRRGPILDPPREQPMDFIEHLRASARFLWRHREQSTLLAPLRKQVCRRLDQLGSLRDNHSRAALAATMTGMDEQQIRDALQLDPEQPAELTWLVSTLQVLRSKL